MSAALNHGATERIAGAEPCSVYRCPCGCVHVHIGVVTVRLAPDTFRDVAAVMTTAAAALLATAPASAHRH